MAAEYDATYGGFGGAPKFPPHMELLFLLRHHTRTGDRAGAGDRCEHTCEQMARGGLYDQLAGGFARYSVDATWTVPHFEKMLYDNALLLRVYTDLWRLTEEPLAAPHRRRDRRLPAARSLLPGGGFASALDADTEGVEGATYVWTPAQLREVLGAADGDWAADLFGVTEGGNFESGTSVLRLARDVDWAGVGGDDAGAGGADVPGRWADVRARLAAARSRRPQPERDDKVVAAWNGLAVTALVEHVAVVRALAPDDPAQSARLERITAAIRDTAEVLARHLVDGRLRRVSRDGKVGEPAGVLDDYGCVAEAFCAVHQLTGEGRWLELAKTLLDTALARFGDGAGGFYDTADDAQQLVDPPGRPDRQRHPVGAFVRRRRPHDLHRPVRRDPLPGGGAGRSRDGGPADRPPPARRRVRRRGGRGAGVRAVRDRHRHRRPDHRPAGAYRPSPRPARRGGGGRGGRCARRTTAADRSKLDGGSTAYVCRGFVCDRPVTGADELAARLAG